MVVVLVVVVVGIVVVVVDVGKTDRVEFKFSRALTFCSK